MIGFVFLLLIGLVAAAGLWALGLPRALWSLVGAALMLGATGYALQGRPGLPGSPTEADTVPHPIDPGLLELRNEMFGRFSGDGAYLVTADGLQRAGASEAAVTVTLAGIRQTPASALLWTGLGDNLMVHDGGQLSPAALFAYRHAARIAPLHPGPPFFEGLAYIRAGQFAAARPLWAHALALCPPRAEYRSAIATRLLVLDRLLAMGVGQGQPG
jgi:cytochrome c-type biogenesis protein CcmH